MLGERAFALQTSCMHRLEECPGNGLDFIMVFTERSMGQWRVNGFLQY
jgi:hypothetical protein